MLLCKPGIADKVQFLECDSDLFHPTHTQPPFKSKCS